MQYLTPFSRSCCCSATISAVDFIVRTSHSTSSTSSPTRAIRIMCGRTCSSSSSSAFGGWISSSSRALVARNSGEMNLRGAARTRHRHLDQLLHRAGCASSTRMRSARKIASSRSWVMNRMVMSTCFQICSRCDCICRASARRARRTARPSAGCAAGWPARARSPPAASCRRTAGADRRRRTSSGRPGRSQCRASRLGLDRGRLPLTSPGRTSRSSSRSARGRACSPGTPCRDRRPARRPACRRAAPRPRCGSRARRGCEPAWTCRSRTARSRR